MNCMFCGRGMAQGVTLHRLNKVGEIGVWACEEHIKRTDVVVDPTVLAISRAINPPRRRGLLRRGRRAPSRHGKA